MRLYCALCQADRLKNAAWVTRDIDAAAAQQPGAYRHPLRAVMVPGYDCQRDAERVQLHQKMVEQLDGRNRRYLAVKDIPRQKHQVRALFPHQRQKTTVDKIRLVLQHGAPINIFSQMPVGRMKNFHGSCSTGRIAWKTE